MIMPSVPAVCVGSPLLLRGAGRVGTVWAGPGHGLAGPPSELVGLEHGDAPGLAADQPLPLERPERLPDALAGCPDQPGELGLRQARGTAQLAEAQEHLGEPSWYVEERRVGDEVVGSAQASAHGRQQVD